VLADESRHLRFPVPGAASPARRPKDVDLRLPLLIRPQLPKVGEGSMTQGGCQCSLAKCAKFLPEANRGKREMEETASLVADSERGAAHDCRSIFANLF